MPRHSLKRTEADLIETVLREPAAGLNIININGPGGIGKTFLWEYVSSRLNLPELGYFILPLDGSTPETRYDFIGLLQQGVTRSGSLKKPGAKDLRFRRLTRLFAQKRMLDARVKDRMAGLARPDQSSSKGEYSELADALIRQGVVLNSEVNKDIEKVIGLAASLASTFFPAGKAANLIRVAPFVAQSLPEVVPQCVRLVERVTTRLPDLATNLHETIAGGLCVDLKASSQMKDKEGQPVYDRFIMILDDYEVTSKSLEGFLLDKLLPKIFGSQHGFKTTVLVVIGRRPIDLEPDWVRIITRCRFERLDLNQFTREECQDLLQQVGCPPTEGARLYQETEGVPYLVNEVIQNLQNGTEGMAAYEEAFISRTTQWMTPQQERWFRGISYLNRIDLNTVTRLFELVETLDPQDAKSAFEWFKQEPSIREPFADSIIVRRIVRNKYLRVSARNDPAAHEEMLAIARQCEQKQGE